MIKNQSFEMRRTRNETNMVSYSYPDASSLSEVAIQLFLISHRKENVNFPPTAFKLLITILIVHLFALLLFGLVLKEAEPFTKSKPISRINKLFILKELSMSHVCLVKIISSEVLDHT